MVVTIKDCKKVIQRYSNGTEEVVDFNIRPLGDAPMGFLGEHYKLNITTQKKDENKLREVDFFLKTLPAGNPKHLEYVLNMGVFRKEALLYKNLLMDFQKLHRNPIAPQCYLVDPDKFIILQDLNGSGYSNQENDLDLDHYKSVIQTMAHFHASTIIFEEARCAKTPYRIIDYYEEELKEATFVQEEGHPRQLWAANTSKCLVDSMKLLSNFDAGSKCGEKLLKIMAKIHEYTRPSQEFRNVITHADLWKNNVMFKQSGGEINSLLIDFQLARYVPPAFDILTTLYVNSNTAFLNDNMDYLLELYYGTFCDCLKTHNIDPESIMSKKDYMKSIQHYHMPALIEAVMFATIIFISDELSNDMLNNEELFNEFTFTNRSKYVESEFATNPYFRERYGGLLQHLVRSLEIYEV